MKTLEISTRIGCRNMCVYCPQEKLLKLYKGERIMSFEQFKLILEHTSTDVKIDFAGFSESFLNPDASLMMRYAIEKGYITVLMTTLVGFNNYDLEILKGLQFSLVFFHEFEGFGFDKEDFEIKVKLFQDNIKAQPYRRSVLEPQWRWSRAGTVWDMDIKKGKFRCNSTDDFDHNVVLPNGDVYLCCMDYELKHYLGNLYETRYEDLDRKSILDLADQEESDIICRKCELFKI